MGMRPVLALAILAGTGCAQDGGNASAPAANDVAAANQAAAPAPPLPTTHRPVPHVGALRYLHDRLGPDGAGARVATAEADLDGDGGNEIIVYLESPNFCGSGGCRVIILTAAGTSWRMAMDASVSRRPIRLLATSSNGWRDLGVSYGGGGLAPGLARMRSDGVSYPDNPTADGVEAVDANSGTMLIAEDAAMGILE